MKLSVCITTYNHASYIAQALDSVLMQKTDFPFEIIVGEDDSSDGTREIVQEYHRKYPDKIRLFLNDRSNVIYVNGRPTGRWNFVNNLQNAKGEYIALLDGDDYWTDPYKLQKQVDYMDLRPEHVSCFHWTSLLDDATGILTRCCVGPPYVQESYSLEDLLTYSNFLPTCSVMFRNGLLTEYPDWFLTVPYADIALHVLNAHYGTIGFLDQDMAVFRKHGGGVCSGATSLQNALGNLTTWEILGSHLHLTKYASYGYRLASSRARHDVHLGLYLRQQGKYREAGYALYKALAFCPTSLRKSILYTILSTFPSLMSWLNTWQDTVKPKVQALVWLTLQRKST